MRANPNAVGSRAEMEVAAALWRAGYEVYTPFFAAAGRIDLVAARAGDPLLRIQCKTGRVVDGALVFRTCSNTGNSPRDYRGELDAFGVFARDLNEAYLVPVDEAGLRACHLRLEPARNGQRAAIRWASQYRIR